MLKYCQLDPLEQTSVNFWSKLKRCYSSKCVWKCRLRNSGQFVSASMCKHIVTQCRHVETMIWVNTGSGLTAPSHYLNKCWLTITGVLWHSPTTYFTGGALDIKFANSTQNYTWKYYIRITLQDNTSMLNKYGADMIKNVEMHVGRPLLRS